MAITDTLIRQRIIDVCQARGPDKTCCPSEIARDLTDDWRPLMARVREQAKQLAACGQIEIRQNGAPVAGDDVRGAIRLGVPD